VIRQYFAQRYRGGNNPLRVGIIPTGSIFYLQDDDVLRGGASPRCRTPWLVEAFLNGQRHAVRRDRETDQWIDLYTTGRSDMAIVRSLRDGRRRKVAIRLLQLHDELGLTWEPTAYPTLPDPALIAQCRRSQADRRTGRST
jgi:hypothetical protein